MDVELEATVKEKKELERGHREGQFLFAGGELWICKSGLGAAIPGTAACPQVSWNITLAVEGSSLLILLLVCG